MPRRSAAERHQDSAPPPAGSRSSVAELVESLIALHHPVRRRLLEALSAHGPATVGQLADSLGLAVGSVSHHLKPLHSTGFVSPAPELARDSRESWWRVVPRSVSFDSAGLPEGSAARQVVEIAERANDSWQIAAIEEWRVGREAFSPSWQDVAGSWDTFVAATPEQLGDLGLRLQQLLSAWSRECREDRAARPEVARVPVYAFARANPVRR